MSFMSKIKNMFQSTPVAPRKGESQKEVAVLPNVEHLGSSMPPKQIDGRISYANPATLNKSISNPVTQQKPKNYESLEYI